MADRIIQGYNIYNKNYVKIKHYEPDHAIFEVKNKNNDIYTVSMVYGYWNCEYQSPLYWISNSLAK